MMQTPSPSTDTHTPPGSAGQEVNGTLGLGFTHALRHVALRQMPPLPQALSQAPQLVASVCRTTHCLPQRVVPSMHFFFRRRFFFALASWLAKSTEERLARPMPESARKSTRREASRTMPRVRMSRWLVFSVASFQSWSATLEPLLIWFAWGWHGGRWNAPAPLRADIRGRVVSALRHAIVDQLVDRGDETGRAIDVEDMPTILTTGVGRV